MQLNHYSDIYAFLKFATENTATNPFVDTGAIAYIINDSINKNAIKDKHDINKAKILMSGIGIWILNESKFLCEDVIRIVRYLAPWVLDISVKLDSYKDSDKVPLQAAVFLDRKYLKTTADAMGFLNIKTGQVELKVPSDILTNTALHMYAISRKTEMEFDRFIAHVNKQNTSHS